MGLYIVAESLDFFARKILVNRLDFLKAGNIRLGLPEPFQQVRVAGLDAIDVPGRYFHGCKCLFGFCFKAISKGVLE